MEVETYKDIRPRPKVKTTLFKIKQHKCKTKRKLLLNKLERHFMKSVLTSQTRDKKRFKSNTFISTDVIMPPEKLSPNRVSIVQMTSKNSSINVDIGQFLTNHVEDENLNISTDVMPPEECSPNRVSIIKMTSKNSPLNVDIGNLLTHHVEDENLNTVKTKVIRQTRDKKRYKSNTFISTDAIMPPEESSPNRVSIVQMTSKNSPLNVGLDIGNLLTNHVEDENQNKSLSALTVSLDHDKTFTDGCENTLKTGLPSNTDYPERREEIETSYEGFINSEGNTPNQLCLSDKFCLRVSMPDGKMTLTKCYDLNNSKVLVVLEPEHFFYCIGVIELEVVQGSVEVLGYTICEKKKKYLTYSPLGSSNLFIKSTVSRSNNEATMNELRQIGLPEKCLYEVFNNKNCSMFILARNISHVSNTVWPNFFMNHLPFSIFPSAVHRPSLVERTVGCILDANIQECGKEFIEGSEWQRIAQDISHHVSPRVILCGGKSVGKSTLLRYLINKCLQKWKKVLVLDFDLGQCEFTVAGCISATIVEEPLLGPNFTHLKEPLRSVFLGEIDVTKCPETYIKGCKSLIAYATNENICFPWIVNTMGFSKGFGVTLTCGIIQNIKPTNVIQIQSRKNSLNFPSILEQSYVASQEVDSFYMRDSFHNYNLHLLQSAVEQHSFKSHKQRGMSPLQARNLVLLSYLSDMLSSKMSCCVTQVKKSHVFQIHINALDLCTTEKCNLSKEEIAGAMNGSLVALCSRKDYCLFPNCFGFGIVRCIDMITGMLYLTTPLPKETLDKVGCLIKGNITLPETLYYNQGPQVTGNIPYMAHTSGGATALFARRDYRGHPTKKKQ